LLSVGSQTTFTSEKQIKYNYTVIQSKKIETKDLITIIDHYNSIGEKNKEKYVILVTCYPINTVKQRWISILKNK